MINFKYLIALLTVGMLQVMHCNMNMCVRDRQGNGVFRGYQSDDQKWKSQFKDAQQANTLCTNPDGCCKFGNSHWLRKNSDGSATDMCQAAFWESDYEASPSHC